MIHWQVPSEPEPRLLHTSWGSALYADISKSIGQAIWRTGVYDLAVSEALCRLAAPGSLVVDVGANIGYMSLLASRSVGLKGTVVAFEPNPGICALLRDNVQVASGAAIKGGQIDVRPLALGACRQITKLYVPQGFADNDGLATLQQPTAGDFESKDVEVSTLDDEFDLRQRISVLKLDVEGFEKAVLEGAQSLLRGGRIDAIIFEDHDVENSGVVDLLNSYGYYTLSVGWHLTGPSAIKGVSRLAKPYEPQNYIASQNATKVLAALKARGWRVLRPLS